MFRRTKRSTLQEVEKDDAELAEILKTINELLRMARGKLAYMKKILRDYNADKLEEDKEKAGEYLALNQSVLEKIIDLLKEEEKLEHDEHYKKRIFAREIENIEEARSILEKLKRVLEKEINLLKYLYYSRVHPEKRGGWYKTLYKTMLAMVKFVNREVSLLEIESQEVQKVSEEIKRLRDRIMKNRKMPLVKSQYYHASEFIFNVGDNVRPAGPRANKRIEEIFERVRKEKFPNRPSRYTCIYVSDDPRKISIHGTVYAVKVEGIAFRTDQEAYTAAFFKESDADVESWAEAYWEGCRGIEPEVLVEGRVTIIGLADYIKVGDRIEIIVDGIEDDDGKQIPKGSKGKINSYDSFDKDLPCCAIMDNGSEVSLPASAIKKVK